MHHYLLYSRYLLLQLPLIGEVYVLKHAKDKKQAALDIGEAVVLDMVTSSAGTYLATSGAEGTAVGIEGFIVVTLVTMVESDNPDVNQRREREAVVDEFLKKNYGPNAVQDPMLREEAYDLIFNTIPIEVQTAQVAQEARESEQRKIAERVRQLPTSDTPTTVYVGPRPVCKRPYIIDTGRPYVTILTTRRSRRKPNPGGSSLGEKRRSNWSRAFESRHCLWVW
jgi:hypothetical protein